ncbi:hypothetical protein OHT76_29945 [Streptomyces sp. NBC_00287]|uniref:hypothetical protein n=1 Tax=Streptomyces sp. NBC_00287 TaxID=2975702 RepID=UPI002E2CFCAD|nr:hypothetical protein [Streptomyces sp. NBC_00287]
MLSVPAEDRLKRLPPEELDTCRELLGGLPVEDALTIFVSGSRAEGWSTAGSNYNFYAIGDIPPGIKPIGGFSVPGGTQRVASHHLLHGDDRVIVRYWSEHDVHWALEQVRFHELRPTLEIWPMAVEFLHRLSIGSPLYGEAEFEQLRSAVDLDLLARYITQTKAMYAESYFTDAVTRLAAGRVYDALLQARLGMEAQLDAYLAARGDTNTQEKWRHRRLEHIDGSPQLLGDFEQALRGPGSSGPQELAAHVQDLAAFSETLNCCVQLACPYSRLSPPDPDTASAQDRVRRSLDVRLARMYDGRVLVVRMDGESAELQPFAALVYGCASGRWSVPQIADHAARTLGIGPDTALDDTRTVVTALAARGLLRPAEAAAR